MKILSIIAAAAVAFLSLSVTAHAEEAPALSAVSAVVINADTGGVLYGKNESVKRAMASTTKIMTALITLESGDLDTPFTVDSMAIRVEGTSMGLKEGDIVTKRALVYGMLLPSGNDAANAAAVNIAGSLSAFAELMNKRAARIGMKDTNFVTPSGLDAKGHVTTAFDMALLTAEALKNPDFRDICSCKTAKVSFGAPPYERTLYNSNKMLSMYEGCIGVKTGFTDNARRCLVSAAERNGCRIIAVTLNAPDDWNDHRKLLDYGFDKVKPYDVRIGDYASEVVGGTAESITVMPSETVTVGLTDEERKNVSVRCSVPGFVYAGIERGDILGYADIFLGGKLYKRVPMEASETVERERPIRGGLGWLIELFSGGAVKLRGI